MKPSFVSTFVQGSISTEILKGVEVKPSCRKDGSTFTNPNEVAELLYPEIKPFMGWGKDQVEFGSAPLLISLLGEHVLSYKDWIMQWARLALIRMRKEGLNKSLYTGDADFWITLIADEPNRAVFKLTNSCTCSPNNAWIIIYEHFEEKDIVHVRAAWNVKGKAAKQSVFDDKKPNLNYFKKTDYATPYADMRDPGFIFSCRDYKNTAMNKLQYGERVEHLGFIYEDWRHTITNMNNVFSLFVEKKD